MRRIPRSNPFLTLGALGILLLAALVLTGARPRPFGGGVSTKVETALTSHSNPLSGESLAKLPEFRELLRTYPPVGEVDRLTTPPGYESSNTGGRIIFAHIADGTIADRDFMQTAITVVNDSEYPVAATLQFYETTPGGVVQPLTVTIDRTTASSFNIPLGKGQMKRLVTSGTGRVKSGWALLRSDQPLAATSSFRRTTKRGIISDVGVEESIQSTEFTFFADSIGSVNTSMALVNPHETKSANVTFELRNAKGEVIARNFKPIIKPKEHLAQYIHELFNKAPGITEFEGSVVVTSDLPLAGITLRGLGELLTSVPMVPARNPRQLVTELDFPQVGNGTYAPSNVRMVSSVIVFNNGESQVKGKVDFIKPDGTPMSVAEGSETPDSFNFTLKPRGVYRLWTKGTGNLQTGWARVTAEDGIAGTAIYQFTTPTGNKVVSEVGVSAASGIVPINAIADSLADCRTGLALANRNATETNKVTLTLYDDDGEPRGSKEVTLPPSGQRALYVDEFFSDVPMLGRVLISGAEDTVAFTLRQVGVLTTSVPTVNPVHGFTPNSVLEFTQNMTGTSPAVRWRIDQNGNDLGLNELKISAPGLGANLNFAAGSELGYGVFLLKYPPYCAGGVVKLISTGTNPLTFNAVISAENIPQGSVLMSGKITGQSSGNLVIELGPTEVPNGDWNNGFGLELDLLLRDDLIKAPAQAGSTNIQTVYTSASQKLTEDGVRIERTTKQPQSFVAPKAGAPLLTSSRPLYPSPGATLVLQGRNFGSNPTVTFRPDGGSEVQAFFPTVVGQGVEVYVPTAAQAGTVKVFNGPSASNQLRTLSLYSPSMTLRKAAGSSTNSLKLALTCTQPPVQFGLATFQLSLLGVSWPPQVGAVGSVVGSYKITGGTQSTGVQRFDVKVESKEANSITLKVLEEDGTDTVGRITVSKASDASSNGVLLSYAPVTLSDIPSVNGFRTTYELVLDGLAFAPATAGSPVYWTVESVSVPASLFGSETGIRAVQETVPIQ